MKKMGSGILWVAQAIYINQKYIYIQSNIAGIIEGAGNQVNGHLDTLPVLFFPSKASSNTVQT